MQAAAATTAAAAKPKKKKKHVHRHDSLVKSVSVLRPGEVDYEVLVHWLSELLRERGEMIYRSKAVLNIKVKTSSIFFSEHMTEFFTCFIILIINYIFIFNKRTKVKSSSCKACIRSGTCTQRERGRKAHRR